MSIELTREKSIKHQARHRRFASDSIFHSIFQAPLSAKDKLRSISALVRCVRLNYSKIKSKILLQILWSGDE